MAAKPTTTYQNNPLLIGIDGLKLLFKNANSIGFYAIAVTALSVFIFFVFLAASFISGATASEAEISAMQQRDAQAFEQFFNPSSPQDVFVPIAREVAIQFAIFVVSLLVLGVLDYAAGRMAVGKTAQLTPAVRAVFTEFPAYLWMYILMVIKIALWSLLLIVPGIIMANRYMLAGTVFFAEGKRGNAAIKRSAELTKGAWLTTYGGFWSWTLISQGLATYVFYPGVAATLYRQYAPITDAGTAKPPAHILSWLVFIIPIALALLFILGVAILIASFVTGTPFAP